MEVVFHLLHFVRVVVVVSGGADVEEDYGVVWLDVVLDCPSDGV